MDGAERELFARTLHRATASRTGAALDAALEEVGWQDALAVDACAAVSLLFELQGEANAASSALDRVVLSGLDLETGSTVGVVLPPLGQWSPPGELDGKHLWIRGLGTAALANREITLVVARAGDREVAVVVTAADLTLRPIRGVDQWLGLVEVTGNVFGVGVQPEPVPTEWASAVALGQLALGHELVGAARKMLELAREHALQRIQFGRPISAFQAIRHRLADTLVAIEMADAMLVAAWQDRSFQTSAMAKALAGRGAHTAARHCQQVLAGMGFTTEHPLHRYVRRVLVLDQLLGSARALTHELGAELLRTKKLPPLLPL
jgi:alkylation response protein AidB-like acyl-CoA dehydrogenase